MFCATSQQHAKDAKCCEQPDVATGKKHKDSEAQHGARDEPRVVTDFADENGGK